MNCYGVLSFLSTKLIVEAADLEVIAPSMRRTINITCYSNGT
jgi:hypothetical protein